MGDKKVEGLHEKFRVTRLTPSSRGIDHTECRYFVLDPKHDPIARAALAEYASLAHAEGFETMSNDITEWLRNIENF